MLSMGSEQSVESIWGTWRITSIGVQNSWSWVGRPGSPERLRLCPDQATCRYQEAQYRWQMSRGLV